ncbi:D-aminoacyl-tRNA deacylase [Corynebacterium bovis]|uniref:D-tyrosyl-tRNA(Tyr) deacylase n=1 Tax=Corynebacterium bovis DSM 20582 = CIP 54.80 TaxID=927655 RepID=A0A8I0CPL2_9CORY|nr:D-aminoacyl-tRNA deacylase [Corynebacterium bovis]MBB3116535.1 D-tyrosyl-tRNA(Tyr) deacylase [Corynebacterium bovis DSM 20582 = CIP 54.80]QQC47702.1 D-tyrosyl-tRNA(Tyr) deacylase [Corynebacterium bovis]RRO82580.1 D-tyrosyl-tRNA(Tyr) deacylase [Corynebacterium bovis]RRO83636.1 D-tyrosyl-tRNA(Tyr) deacylase [Corynebacterium bovis]RRO83680.1 D-tyrosyl-tRNA(Tyr) deacylase [Corynebacterium bovis]
MRAVVSTVREARVTVDGEVVGSVTGRPLALLVLLGVGRDDAEDAWRTVSRKIAELRILPAADDAGAEGPRTAGAVDVGAEVLLVSQFTLMGATAKGRRPSWAAAAPGPDAEPVVAAVAEDLRARGLHVETGRFGAAMDVESVNAGPFTVIVEA